jgi:hypothetical protein
MHNRRFGSILAVAIAVACATGGKDDEPTDTDTTDVTDVAPTDVTDDATDVTDAPTDVGSTDVTDITDGGITDPVDDTARPDPSTDVPMDTGSFQDCPYTPLNQYLVDCGGKWSYVNDFLATFFRRPAPPATDLIVIPISDRPDPSDCPVQYGFNGPEGEDMGQVLAANTCSDTCVYVAQQAVMVLYCGSRGEYITWGQGGPGQTGAAADCPPMIEGHTVAGDGFYPTWEDYQAAHPCP